MKKNIYIINNISNLKEKLVDSEEKKYYFLNENKGSILAFEVMKIILEEYSKIYRIFFLGLGWSENNYKKGELVLVDRTFLFSEDIIDNQRISNNQIHLAISDKESLDNINCNTLFNTKNTPKDLNNFGDIYDLEAFWIAQLSSQIGKKIFILKYIENEEINTDYIVSVLENIKEREANIYVRNDLESKILKTDNWEKYFENPIQDNFKYANLSIRIIESSKKGELIRHTPEHYGPVGSVGYSILRGYNCLGSCKYCYLQSYFKSPDMVKFGNTEDFLSHIKNFVSEFRKNDSTTPLFFYDGDAQDSLGYYKLEENIKQLNKFIDMFESLDNTFFEIRTKCIKENIEESYENLKIGKNTIYAITFSPERIIDMHEESTATLDKRIEFAHYIIGKGGKIGIRLDPFIFDQGNLNCSLDEYKKLIDRLKKEFKKEAIFNIAVGTLRLKETLHKSLKKVNSPLVNNIFKEGNFYRYKPEIRKQIYTFLEKELKGFSKDSYVCMDYS